MAKAAKLRWLYLVVIITLFISQTIQSQNQFPKPKFKARSNGVPAAPDEVKITEPDGGTVNAHLKGDGAVHWYQTKDGYTILKGESGFYEYAVSDAKGNLKSSGFRVNNRLKSKSEELNLLSKTPKDLRYSKSQVETLKNNYLPASSNGPSKAFPASGTRKLLLILIDFPDRPHTFPSGNFDNLLNQTGYNGTGSFKDYYSANSFGQLNITTTVTGWYTASHNHDYYCESCSGADKNNTYRELVREAVDAAEANGVDFSIYDNDGDGIVDGVMVIHQGDGAESGDWNNIWSNSWILNPGGSYSNLSVTYDGVLINDYTLNPETINGLMGTIGVLCHEFGHNLGLPDFYDTDYNTGSGGQSFDLGNWDCMASGNHNNGGATPANHNSYTRNILGWQTASELTGSTEVTLPNAAQNNISYYYTTSTPNEYFWFENRQQISSTFDRYIPGHGLLIFHIDRNYAGWNNNSINVNPSHNAMDIEEADNIKTNVTTAGDPFPGTSNNTSFTDFTTPNSLSWANDPTNKYISAITEDLSTKTVSFNFVINTLPVAITGESARTSLTSATLKGQASANGLPSTVTFEYGTTTDYGSTINATPNIITGTSLTSHSAELTGLTPNITYHYRIKVVNSNGTSYGSDKTFTLVQLNLPVTESFNSATMPNGWTTQNIGNGITERWKINKGYIFPSNQLFCSQQCPLTGVTRAITPPINTVGISGIELSFKHDLNDYRPGAIFRVQSSTDLVNWTNEEWSLTSGLGDVDPITINTKISNNINSPTTYIAFEIEGDLGGFMTWVIDDVSLAIACSPPTTQASEFTSSNISDNSMTISWKRGNGSSVLVVARQYGAVNSNPAPCNAYSANSSFGSGAEIGSGNFVVYNGKSTSVNITNLSPGTKYYFAVYEYSETNCYKRLELMGNATTTGISHNFQAANIVVGQADFAAQSTQFNLTTTPYASVCAISSKGVMAVGSYSCGRVLIWNHVPEVNGHPADVVVGQTDFASTLPGISQSLMTSSYGICFSPDGNKLIVSDQSNNRVLIWNSIPTFNGQPADVVIGQTNFVSNSYGCTANKFFYPAGVTVTPDGKLIVCDYYNCRVLIFNKIPTTNGASANVVIGQPDMTSSGSGSSSNQLCWPMYSVIAPDGKLLISDKLNNRVLIFSSVPKINGASAVNVIGQPGFNFDTWGVSPTKLKSPEGVTISKNGNFAIGDLSNNRVLIYNNIPLGDGASADIVLGQPEFYTRTYFNGGISAKSMYDANGINFDQYGRLFVSGWAMNRVMIFGDVPIQKSELSLNFTTNSANICNGSSVQYILRITNNGPGDATNVIAQSMLPVGFTPDGRISSSSGNYNPASGSWIIPSIPNGGSQTLIFNGKIQPSQTVTAFASIVNLEQEDINLANNGSSITLTSSSYIAPTIAQHPFNQFVMPVNPASFNVSATGTALTYQWQLNAGTGVFANLSNGTTYSGVYSNTLNISEVNSSMDKYLYRCIVSGSGSCSSASSAATLVTSGSCLFPAIQATFFSTTAITFTSISANWIRGDGTNILVVVRQGSPVNADPVNGTIYNANAAFGSGTQIGTGNYVVYNGTGTSVSVTGLISGNTYYFAIYEYSSGTNCYKTPALIGNATTHICTPTAPTIEIITQPTCLVETGSVVLNGLSSTGTWTLTQTPGGIIKTGTGTSTIISGLTEGTYAYTVTNEFECTSTSSGNVFINSQPSTPTAPIITLNGNILHSNTINGNQWLNQLGLIDGATNQDYTVTLNGEYYAIVTMDGCISSSSNIINVVISGIELNENNYEIKVYPNPVSKELIIEIDGNNKKINFEILNLLGKTVYKSNLFDKTIVQTTSFVPGVYLIKFENGKTFQFKKIIKE